MGAKHSLNANENSSAVGGFLSTIDGFMRKFWRRPNAASMGKGKCEYVEYVNDCSEGGKFELTDMEQAVLKESWSMAEATSYENAGQRIFRKVFDKSPDIYEIFAKSGNYMAPCPDDVDTSEINNDYYLMNSIGPPPEWDRPFYKHVRAFMNIIELAVNHSDCLWKIRHCCIELGRRHREIAAVRGFRPEYWLVFKEALMECVIEWAAVTDQSAAGLSIKSPIVIVWCASVNVIC